MDRIFGNVTPNKYPLRQTLLDEYGVADKRIKKVEKATYFRVDSCQGYDGADGQPLSHVCTIFVDATDESTIKVSLNRNVPMSETVSGWTFQNEGHYNGLQWPYTRLECSVKKGQQHILLTLAQSIQDIVKPGRQYNTPSYKYSCPRTAGALEHLKLILDKAWG